MTLDAAYTVYTAQPNDKTLSTLYYAITRYTETLAGRWGHPDPTDAAASVGASAWEHLGSFSGESFRAWVRQIAVNLLISEYKKKLSTIEFNPNMTRNTSTERFKLVSLTGLTSLQRDTVQTLINTGDFERTAELMNISRETLQRRLNRLRK